jgi:hypothetical protein
MIQITHHKLTLHTPYAVKSSATAHFPPPPSGASTPKHDNASLTPPCLRVYRLSYELSNQHNWGVTVGTLLHNSGNQSHCLNTYLRQWKPKYLLEYTVATMRAEIVLSDNNIGSHCCLWYNVPSATPLEQKTSPHVIRRDVNLFSLVCPPFFFNPLKLSSHVGVRFNFLTEISTPGEVKKQNYVHRKQQVSFRQLLVFLFQFPRSSRPFNSGSCCVHGNR